jgi:hypothetical protein
LPKEAFAKRGLHNLICTPQNSLIVEQNSFVNKEKCLAIEQNSLIEQHNLLGIKNNSESIQQTVSKTINLT